MRTTWRADGEANRYTITEGGDISRASSHKWIASVLLNGELTTAQQETIMHKMVAALNQPTSGT